MKIADRQIKSMVFYMVVLMTTILIYTLDGVYYDSKVLISNLIIIILSLVFMVTGDKYNYSLNKIFMLFSFFFFGIAPAVQYQYGVTIWRGAFFSEQKYFHMNLVIIWILITYQAFYHLFGRLKHSNSMKEKKIKNEVKCISKKTLLYFSVISMLITLHYNSYDLVNILFRSSSGVERLVINQSIGLIYSNFIRPIPIIALVLFKLNNIKDKKLETALIIIALLTNFPTSRARFYIAAMYIPIAIVYIRQFNKRYLMMNKLLIIGLLVVFPFLDQARNINRISDFTVGLDFRMFLQGHFDSFQMFMRVIDENYITMGSQLLTALLFFVPRSIWPDKSIGSGALMAGQLDLSFDNVSMNYFGEGYINFGYMGVFVFVIILAYINARLDKKYWSNYNEYGIMSPYYLFFIGLEFFILRGDMLSSVSFSLGILTSICFVSKAVGRKYKIKSIPSQT